MIRVSERVFHELIEHARQDAPIEACGYLAARDGMVVEAIRLKNVDASPEHFTFDPKEQFMAVRRIRKEGLELRAAYHSHPGSPARPSAEDIRLALDASLSYVIVSLAKETPDVKSFSIQNGNVRPEQIQIVSEVEEQVNVL